MSDLVKRLRQCLPKDPGHTHRLPTLDMVREAADRIEALEAAARPIVEAFQIENGVVFFSVDADMYANLKRALEGK